jgi:hypothetical protein
MYSWTHVRIRTLKLVGQDAAKIISENSQMQSHVLQGRLAVCIGLSQSPVWPLSWHSCTASEASCLNAIF